MIRTVLRTEHVTMQFGGVIAVNDLNKGASSIPRQKEKRLTSPAGNPARSHSWALPAPSRISACLKT